MEFDAGRYTYPSRRNMVYARRAVACSSIPQGAQIGLETMRQGGNAVDAAVAMAAAMPLLEPTGNGLGSDCFALVWMEKEQTLYGLNASGPAPAALSARLVRERGFAQMPTEGWLPVTVPGAVGGWGELNRRFGDLPLERLFAPAVQLAREGAPVAVNVGPQWARDCRRIPEGPAHAEWRRVFLHRDGSPYRCGELFCWPEYAESLEELARTGCESFYRGALMERMVEFAQQTGGFFRKEDFEGYRPAWVDPISVDYRGYTVCEIPPNGHGLTVLMALKLLGGFDLDPEKETAENYHRIVESIKLAFADTRTYVADPDYMTVGVDQLLSDAYLDRRRALIGEKALVPRAGDPSCGGTVYLCTADGEGNMVSFIQSNYTTFGAGVAVPGTGISLQNRGANFSLDPASDNCLAGGKRPYHTIIPGFLLKNGQAVGPFGVMGAFMQPQGHVQVLVNAIDCHMNPQQCLDAPRVQWTGGLHIQLEPGVSPEIARALEERGHEVERISDPVDMGRGQIIWRLENGLYCAGTEPRCDGTVAAF